MAKSSFSQVYDYVFARYNEAMQVYQSAKTAYQSKDTSSLLSSYAKLQAIATSCKNVLGTSYDNMFQSREAKNALQTARKYLQQINSWLSQVDAWIKSLNKQGNTSDLSNDSRNEDWSTTNTITDPSQIGTIGDLMSYTQSQLGNTEGSEQKSYLDLLAQLLSSQQQYKWQQESDDLAYQRSSYATKVAQLTALGMSRIAAIQAVSGSTLATSGSTVGSSLSPTLASSDIAQQQADTAQQGVNNQYALGLEGNSINSRLVSAQTGYMNEQERQIREQTHQLENVNWNADKVRDALVAISETYEHTYGMHALHVDVPTSATISQKAYKDWLRDVSDGLNELDSYMSDTEFLYEVDGIKMRMHHQDDNRVVCEYYDENGDLQSFELMSDETYRGLQQARLCYASIQKNHGNLWYGNAFEQLFMSNAGPRAYHEQEDASRLKMYQIQVDFAATQLQELQTKLLSSSFQASLQSRVYTAMQNDPSLASAYNEEFRKNGWVVNADTHQITDATGTPVTSLELLNSVCPELAEFFYYNFENLSAYQSAALATDMQSFQYALRKQQQDAKNGYNQAAMMDKIYEKARKWLDSDFLSGMGAVKILGDVTGASAMAAGAFRVGAAIATGGSTALISGLVQTGLQNQKHNHRMQEIGFQGQLKSNPSADDF